MDICSICLEPLNFHTLKNKCGHSYHNKCTKMLINNDINKCPLCRRKLTISINDISNLRPEPIITDLTQDLVTILLHNSNFVTHVYKDNSAILLYKNFVIGTNISEINEKLNMRLLLK